MSLSDPLPPLDMAPPLRPLRRCNGRSSSRLCRYVAYGKDRCDDRLREGQLLLFESARVDAAFGIESENGKRVPNDAHRVSGHKLDHDAGHSRSLPRKDGQTVPCRISQHPVELGAWQPPAGNVASDEKRSAGKTLGSAPCIKGDAHHARQDPTTCLPSRNSALPPRASDQASCRLGRCWAPLGLSCS
jgi:hypothetical protein